MENTEFRILIIDDSPLNQAVLRKILENDSLDASAGKSPSALYTIDKAMNGIEGLEKVGEFKPDLILLDIEMPEMDGFETIKLLNKNEKTSGIPVIFLISKDVF
jgi:CheY-like chemotaxis protein